MAHSLLINKAFFFLFFIFWLVGCFTGRWEGRCAGINWNDIYFIIVTFTGRLSGGFMGVRMGGGSYINCYMYHHPILTPMSMHAIDSTRKSYSAN